MINRRHIIVILLIYLTACTSSQSEASSQSSSDASKVSHVIKEYKGTNTFVFTGEAGFPLAGILKKNTRPGIGKSYNSSTIFIEKPAGASVAFSTEHDSPAFHMDRLLRKQLDHNYPSHNFW
jgi:hypothetical protein